MILNVLSTHVLNSINSYIHLLTILYYYYYYYYSLLFCMSTYVYITGTGIL